MTSRRRRAVLAASLCGAVLAGCAGPPRNEAAIRRYYRYDFTGARAALREPADRNDGDVLLNNVRLGLAAMADGDTVEAERALQRAFDLLSTAGLNKDRTTAAILLHEGVRIWKGEPFEQALAYYWVAAFYATLGDWENARAAAANALFRLTDFGGDQTASDLARRAARDSHYLDRGYTAVDTDFALGFLIEAIGSGLSGAPGSAGQLDAALRIDPGLAPIVDVLRSGEYDTLLLVDYGRGPAKIAYGPDDALARFAPQDDHHGDLNVTAGGRAGGRFPAACDVNEMSVELRWNNLENIRVAKSTIGNLLLAAGAVTLSASGSDRSGGTAVAGLAAMIGGLLAKAGARADTRYMEFAPQSIYLAPLDLGESCTLEVSVTGDEGSTLVLPEFRPGRRGAPRAVYLRLNGPGAPEPDWMRATLARYGNDATGVRPGDWPWILGGRDVSTPTPETLGEYRLSGRLPALGTAELESIYRAEEIVIGAGGVPGRPESYRHVLDGGRALFTPQPDSMGYKRLMYSPHAPYEPRSALVREMSTRPGPAGPVEYASTGPPP